MTPITDTDTLAEFCSRLAAEEFIAVDTEFMRERTYWPKLCLVQVAGSVEAAAIDTLAPGIDLTPLFELLNSAPALKVFHAARQDIEIFLHLSGVMPHPLFDTQIAGMVCGFGDAVSYDRLVAALTGESIDKTSRYTDWAHRPLSERQIEYALSDVIHLRPVYEKLAARLKQTGRAGWLEEEVAQLGDPATYLIDPEEAWRRLKVRSTKPRFLVVLREVAAWREREAQRRDLPRNWVLRDDAILEIAAQAPTTQAELARCRAIGSGQAEGRMGADLVACVQAALALPRDSWPKLAAKAEPPPGRLPVADLLRVLLKTRCEEHHVAQKLVASSEDLEWIAADDDADVPALHGWRRQIFGEDALALKRGALALTAKGGQVRLIRSDGSAAHAAAD